MEYVPQCVLKQNADNKRMS